MSSIFKKKRHRARQVSPGCRENTLNLLASIYMEEMKTPGPSFKYHPEASLPAGKSARRLLPGGSLCPQASQPGGFCPEAVFARRQEAVFARFCPEAVFARRQVSPEASAWRQSLPVGKSARRLLPGGSLCPQASQPGGNLCP